MLKPGPNAHSCENHFMELDPNIRSNARKSLWVLAITVCMMVAEIYFGSITSSMALTADGWHMSTHALAIGITYLTYRLATRPEMARNFNFGGGKILALGGFTSGVILIAVFGLILKESIERLLHPESIGFNEALLVAGLGLVVNVVSALILRDHHHGHGSHAHDHEHGHDHHHDQNHDQNRDQIRDHVGHNQNRDLNIRAAYTHVLADAVTSVGAIVALLLGKFMAWRFLDPLIGIVGAFVILNWSWSLIKETGWELLDGHARQIDYQQLRARIESEGARIHDLHVWSVSPNVLACELIVITRRSHGIEFFRRILELEFSVRHSVIEERLQN